MTANIDGRLFHKRCGDWQGVERAVSWLRRHAHNLPAVRPQSGYGAWVASLLVALALAFASAPASAQPTDSPQVEAFVNATLDYARLHRRLEAGIGTIDVQTPVESINRMILQLGAAIRAERPGARQGDLFAPPLAEELRARVAGALDAHGFTADDVRAAGRVDRVDYSRVRLAVNDMFPWILGVAMFPCVIEVLPPLPPELQYRIVDDDLVLIDLHASLIVDILPSILADAPAAVPPAAAPAPRSVPVYVKPLEIGADAKPDGVFEEPQWLVRIIDVATRTVGDGSSDKTGVYLEQSQMITGAGWLSLGPGYRRWIDGDEVFVDVSTAMSWRSYRMARGRLEFTKLARSRLALGAEARWQDLTQNTYFGRGPESNEADRSEYRLKSLNAVGYANIRPRQWLTIGTRLGWLRSPELLAPAGRFQRGHPATTAVFPNEPAFARVRQPDYLHGELSLTADTRDHRSHPLSGGVYRGAWTRFSDRESGAFSFQRFDAEAAHVLATNDGRVALVVHGWVVATDTADSSEIPFYLMPSLGGSNTLRAFPNYRFHDRHMALTTAEVRLALLSHVDAAVFVDAGNVAPRIADLNIDRRSIGVGVRLHSGRATFARLDAARGAEGWRLTFNTSDPLHLSRLSRRTAPVPFVP